MLCQNDISLSGDGYGSFETVDSIVIGASGAYGAAAVLVALAMGAAPSDQCLGPDDRDSINDRRAKAIESGECQPVCIGHPNAPRCLPTQNV